MNDSTFTQTSLRRAFDLDTHQWEGAEPMEYKAQGEGGAWSQIIRHHLAGQFGENLRFHLRYFQIEPGGSSSLETHEHEHVVIGVRGEGVALLAAERVPVRFLDVIYVSPHALHQFKNESDQPFGFFCIVNAERDKPVVSACELPAP